MSRTAAEYKIVPCYAHFEVYKQGIFMSSADTISEAEREIQEHEQNQINEQKERKLSA